MPIIHQSTYPGPPIWLFNSHLQTLIPSLIHRKLKATYHRQRLELSDGDFLDLDWLTQPQHGKLLILSHGLEGNSQKAYIIKTAQYFYERGWDSLAWNCRSCSGEMNKAFKMYHHGDVEDINIVVEHALATQKYHTIALVGFSMGGSINLKYVGTKGNSLPSQIKYCIAFSTPCDLEKSAGTLDLRRNKYYRNHFLSALRKKIEWKHQHYPGVLDISKFEKIKVWRDFDEYFSAPLNGYRSADEFYENSSAKNYLKNIAIPTLIVNAQNDPILTPESSPTAICKLHDFVHLETPTFGGHVTFPLQNIHVYWPALRTFDFTLTHVPPIKKATRIY